MATIDAASVKKLRELTSAGIMDCKAALTEAGGDFDRAVAILREKDTKITTKLEGRQASEGLVGVYLNEDATLGGIVEVNCETDFVARNEAFVQLAADLAYQAAYTGGVSKEDFLKAAFIKDESKTVEDIIKEAVGTLRENIQLSRFAAVTASAGIVGSYVHSDGKKGAIVVAEGEATDAVKDAAKAAAMQAVALRAPYLNRDEVPAEVIEAEKEIYRKQGLEEGKPEAMLDKIAEGRINKYFKENTLVEQAFIRDDKKSVQQFAKEAGATIVGFVRYEVGQAS
jgi:elongation factor Ts